MERIGCTKPYTNDKAWLVHACTTLLHGHWTHDTLCQWNYDKTWNNKFKGTPLYVFCLWFTFQGINTPLPMPKNDPCQSYGCFIVSICYLAHETLFELN